ncbi:MAG TPA: ABC transporter C-terminal domain-containing protein, partial [Chthoniobacterales bacterium]|nr:ABC transporter C-terminal domain-containing protein [Chthoniobacterales bacterium]
TNLQPETNRAEESKRGPGLREQKEQKRAEAEIRKAEAKAKREREQRVHELEMQIATLEGRQKELAAELEDPVVYEPGGRAVAINRELSAVSDELERLTAEWEAGTAELAPG